MVSTFKKEISGNTDQRRAKQTCKWLQGGELHSLERLMHLNLHSPKEKKGWQEIKLIEIHKIFKYYEDAKIQNIFSVVKLDKMRIVEENANHHQARRT